MVSFSQMFVLTHFYLILTSGPIFIAKNHPAENCFKLVDAFKADFRCAFY